MRHVNKRSFIRWIQVLLAAGTLLLPVLWAVDAPLAGDTYISSAAPTSNFGAAVNMLVSPGNSGLVQFDLSSVPASANVTAAYLVVYANKVTAAGVLNFAAATSAWTESGVTSNLPPTVGSVFGSTTASVGNSFLLVNVTSLVQGWLASPATNFGIEITSGGVALVQLDTKENTTTSHPAQLALTILGPAGPTGSAGLPGNPGNPGPTGVAGATGASGALGPLGPTGPTGAVGPSGPQGPRGADGLNGPAGAAGSTGPVGPSGPQGAVGAAGNGGAAGIKGATGPSGPSGSAGTAGAVGVAGAVGATGASGPNGPTSNKFAMDTTVHAPPFTIPDTDQFLYYLIGNSASSFAQVALPHATVVGKMVILLPANAAASSGVSAVVQAGDTLIGTTGAVSSVVGETKIMALSDGSHKWYVLTSSISQ